jgi:hypothetical protein
LRLSATHYPTIKPAPVLESKRLFYRGLNFKQVLLCRRKHLANADIAFATKLSLRLVEEYQDLIEDYGKKHPQWECNGQPWLDDLIDKLEKTVQAANHN